MFCCIGRDKMHEDALNTVELRVRMHCDGCERRIRKAISKLEGVTDVDVDTDKQKVTVTGYVDRRKVLKTVRRTGTRAEFWPFPFDSEYHRYVAQYYDESTFTTTYNYYKHGYNSNLQGSFPNPIYSHVVDDHALGMFNDENVNACVIM